MRNFIQCNEWVETHVWAQVAVVIVLMGLLAWNAISALDQLGQPQPVGADSTNNFTQSHVFHAKLGDEQWIRMPPATSGGDSVWCVITNTGNGDGGQSTALSCDFGDDAQN